jgi:hypothetical protein
VAGWLGRDVPTTGWWRRHLRMRLTNGEARTEAVSLDDTECEKMSRHYTARRACPTASLCEDESMFAPRARASGDVKTWRSQGCSRRLCGLVGALDQGASSRGAPGSASPTAAAMAGARTPDGRHRTHSPAPAPGESAFAGQCRWTARDLSCSFAQQPAVLIRLCTCPPTPD